MVSPEDLEVRKRAFDLWISDPGNTYKSISKELGMSSHTIGKWAKEDDWKRQFIDTRYVAPKQYVQARGEEMMDLAIGRLSSIIEGGQDSDANAAIKTLISLIGIGKGDAQVVVNDNRSVTQINGREIKNVDDIRRFLSLRAENNIIDVESKRRTRDI